MIMSPLPTSIRICCSIANAIKESKGLSLKRIERVKRVVKRVVKSIWTEMLVGY